jgi:hypothetical protein
VRTNSVGRRARLEDDDRLSGASRSVAVQVLVQSTPTLPQRFTLLARRSLPSTSRRVQSDGPARRPPPGWACRFSHQAGWRHPSRSWPSRPGWARPRNSRRSRAAAHRYAGPASSATRHPTCPGAEAIVPLRRPLARTIHRCTCQAVTTNHRGGTRALELAMRTPLSRTLPNSGTGRCSSGALPASAHERRPTIISILAPSTQRRGVARKNQARQHPLSSADGRRRLWKYLGDGGRAGRTGVACRSSPW